MVDKNDLISFKIDGISVWRYKEIQEPEELGKMYNLFGTIKPLNEIKFFLNSNKVEYDTDFDYQFSPDGKKTYSLNYYFKDFKINQDLVNEMDEIVKTLKFKKQ